MSSSSNKFPRGGASTESTPANNMGGGSGLGDSGYPKGGSSTGQSNNPRDQKSSVSETVEYSDKTDSNLESRSFAGHKPGHPETLPGWNKLKDVAGYTS